MADAWTPSPGRVLIEGKTGKRWRHGDPLPAAFVTDARIRDGHVVKLKKEPAPEPVRKRKARKEVWK